MTSLNPISNQGANLLTGVVKNIEYVPFDLLSGVLFMRVFDMREKTFTFYLSSIRFIIAPKHHGQTHTQMSPARLFLQTRPMR